ncbi:hypothetical protein NIM87_03925 [Devosia sp. XJ19-1]|uniref:Uncharacterized protein n=1 Tax=Devosia ureilytica TaxID=2952754 RepID=A0A9Q4ANV3_9HYPH|nr:hypothetical protein [Devosia ureilytica]MCP8882635.1 hypothetical protein [Devosia ureilytica]MCP8886997.1 hypothetical protein [Devosia ureilytica]
MGSGTGISPSVMINRMVHRSGVPQAGHLLEVARLRGEMAKALSDNAASPLPTTKPAEAPINGAEVDLLI